MSSVDTETGIGLASWARDLCELLGRATDDVVFTAPPYEGQGLGKLVKHIEQFQEQVPGAHFKSNKLLL